MATRRAFMTGLMLATLLGATQQAMAQDKVIRIGAPLPLTGALAPEGIKQQEGYDLWAEEVNKAGGIKVGNDRYKVQLVYYDYQSATPRAVQLTEKLASEDKVNFIFSPFGSGATKASSNVSEKYKIPTISSTGSSEQVYDQGYKYLFGTLNSNVVVSKALTKYFKEKAPNVKKVAIYSRNDLFPLALATSLDDAAKAAGYQVIYFEKYPLNAMDHSAALTELRAKGADWIYVSGYTDDLIRIRKQMSENKVSAPVITMLAGPAYPEFTESLGDIANGVTSVTWWHPALRFKENDVFGSTENFVKLFQAKYHKVADYAQASSSVAGVVLQLAIEKAGSIDPEKVRDVLANTKFDTFYGPIKFGPSGQNVTADNPIFQIQNKKITIIAPPDVKAGDLQLIK
ncbi:MAG TPA: amino acid ABC transporter substrate-binding protein [Rhizomicrobium sp.]|jgi:branched-chain amino acid transport system substrate-binding protein|nr:amino acid ABC transporter substrate-binding protein [Rhizomicrobium sp.]HTM71726.1 amino acid ABC transporter substrate-binding protein [Pseudolabrys sp.]